LKILRDESGFVIWGERFVSYQEVQCFRYLQWLRLTPKDMRHEYQVGRCSFDFFPLGKVFWEHHPISMRSGEDLYQYGKKRRQVLNASGYSKIPLVVSDSMFRDQWEVCDLMNDYEVDFKRGRVKGDPTICFVRDYSREYAPVLSETWKASVSNDFPLPDQLLGSY
jgi:hypothetical protein